MRCPLVTLVLALLLACARNDEHSGSELLDTGDDDPSTCTPGRFGCSCEAGACSEGLECVMGVCELVDESNTTGAAPPSSCGWNRAASWYDCGFSGSDPNGLFPSACPPDLVASDPCPPSLPFEGCCDAQGDVWYCDEGRVVHTGC